MTPIPTDQVIQLGIAGIVLGWFMIRADRLLASLIQAVQENTQAVQILAERIGPGWERERLARRKVPPPVEVE